MESTENRPVTQVSHTPGPWKAIKGFGPLDDPNTDQERWCVVAAANDREYLIATIENGQPGDCLETEGHTAHLIAAAPTMKAALLKAVETIKALHSLGLSEADAAIAWRIYQQSPEMKVINGAIAEAEGRS